MSFDQDTPNHKHTITKPCKQSKIHFSDTTLQPRLQYSLVSQTTFNRTSQLAMLTFHYFLLHQDQTLVSIRRNGPENVHVYSRNSAIKDGGTEQTTHMPL